MVSRGLNHLFLKSCKRFLPFAAEQMHIDAKDSEKRISTIFGAQRLTASSPRSFSSSHKSGQRFTTLKSQCIDPCPFANCSNEIFFGSNIVPVVAVEGNVIWREEFL